MRTWRVFGSLPSAPPSPVSPFLTPTAGPPPSPSPPAGTWLPSEAQSRGWRANSSPSALSPGSRNRGSPGAAAAAASGGLPSPAGSPGRRGSSPGPALNSSRRRWLLAAAAALLVSASLILAFIKPSPLPGPLRPVVAVHSVGQVDSAGELHARLGKKAATAVPGSGSGSGGAKDGVTTADANPDAQIGVPMVVDGDGSGGPRGASIGGGGGGGDDVSLPLGDGAGFGRLRLLPGALEGAQSRDYRIGTEEVPNGGLGGQRVEGVATAKTTTTTTWQQQQQPQQQHQKHQEEEEEGQQQPRAPPSQRQHKQGHQQPESSSQRGGLRDTGSMLVSENTENLVTSLNTLFAAAGGSASGHLGSSAVFGARTGQTSSGDGGGRVSGSGGVAAAGSGGYIDVGSGAAEADDGDGDDDELSGRTTRVGSEALRTAREALARHKGGSIPRIIHQMYGLFDTTPSPHRRDRLMGPAPAPNQAIEDTPRRQVLEHPPPPLPPPHHHQQQQQQQQQQRLQQPKQQEYPTQRRRLQGWAGGPEASIQSWKRMNPDYTHIVWGAADVDELVETIFPAFAPAFRSFQRLPVLRADLARYLVVFTFGGVYADTDTLCLRPIDGWADNLAPGNVSAIVGVEADAGSIAHWERFWGRQLQFCQWTFAAEPAHPLLAHVVFRISQLLEQRSVDELNADDVIHVTGPSVMSDAVYDYLKSKGHDWHEFEGLTHGTLVGDLLVLPITAFSPGVGHMGAGPVGHPEARVQHLFGGSWRKQGAPKRSNDNGGF